MWWICKFYKAGFANFIALLTRLGGGDADLYCGLDVMRAYNFTDLRQCVEWKQKLFSDGINRRLWLHDYGRWAIARGCAMFLRKLGKKAPDGGDFSSLSLEEILQYGANELTRQDRTVFECLFATLYLSQIGSHISSPPVRLGCMHFSPDRLRFISENFPTLDCLLEEEVFGSSDRPGYRFWFTVPRREDAYFLSETGDGTLLLTEPGCGVTDYRFTLTFWDEACAIYDPSNRLADENSDSGLWIGENRFERLTDGILRQLQRFCLPQENPGDTLRPGVEFEIPQHQEFRALAETAFSDIRDAPPLSSPITMALAIALETESGRILHTLICAASYDGLTPEEEALIGQMEESGGVAVRAVCLWRGGCWDLPSYDFRERMLALSPKNRDTQLLLTSADGLMVWPLWKTMSNG